MPQKSKIDKALISMLSKAVTATADEDGWVNLGAVGSHVAKQSPEFDSRNYGFARLSDLVEATGKFDIDRSGRTQKGVLIHLKTVPTTTKK
ncbi:OST-HTH/LOTUS domain protein [Agrobacterium sp. DSM 25558]|nr:OST-HTH/LOTUS domain protein [Agrobacterium sp. DSM 25558]